jgi:hypothetical protein
MPEGDAWDPYGLTLDPSRELVYVGDHDFSKIFVFSYDGTFHGRVGTTMGYLFRPDSIAIKPGPLSSLSNSSLISSPPPAGTPAVFTIDLHDPSDLPIPDSYDMASDVFLYHAEAAYIVEDNGASVTIPCDVLYNETVPPSAALSVSCELTLATTYGREQSERDSPPSPSPATLLLASLAQVHRVRLPLPYQPAAPGRDSAHAHHRACGH